MWCCWSGGARSWGDGAVVGGSGRVQGQALGAAPGPAYPTQPPDSATEALRVGGVRYGLIMTPVLNQRRPVTADDVDRAVRALADALAGVPDDAWKTVPEGSDWTCRETLDHLSDTLLSYAGQIAGRRPPREGWVPFAWDQRPGGPPLAVKADPESGTAGILQVFEACGALLAAMARTAPPDTRGYHVFGVSDPGGFAAMGVVEVTAHGWDVARGLGVDVEVDEDALDRVLYRLFPEMPEGFGPWPTFLWATGRGELPDLPRRKSWRWFGEPVA